ncbi:MAG: acetoin utilization protein AcuC [Gammaproteobacteria bacterium]|nr:acetoin utilization protein AcuC [Gammaproteobacteria bacterium]
MPVQKITAIINFMSQKSSTCVYLGAKLASYGFGNQHPFGPGRHQAFETAFKSQHLDHQIDILEPVMANRDIIELFHTPTYIDRVMQQSRTGQGYLDSGDTPAFKGIFEAASYVAGSVIDAVNQLLNHHYQHAFVPIAGLHHARRDSAAGFCVFNDCAIAIEYLKLKGMSRILYIDIDAHHGDGVFYAFEDDPHLIFIDIHESGEHLYPGTGNQAETGLAAGQGLKLNIPLSPGADDNDFYQAWDKAESFLKKFEPEFILLQSGVDSMANDPITHLKYSFHAHSHATRSLVHIANRYCDGKLLVMGGGGYNHQNIADGWTSVVKELIA